MSSPRASSFPSRKTRSTASAARSDKGSSSPDRWIPEPCSTFSPGARSGRTRAAGRRPMQHSHEALDRPGGLSGGHLLSPLRHREFRVLWAGMAVSLLGDGIFLIAIAWESYTLWNAPAALSIVGIGMAVPTVLFLLAGGIVSDRHDRRLVMMCADGVRALAVAVLAVLVIAGSLRFWELVALVAVKEGLRFIRKRVWLWGTLGSAAIAYLVFLGPTEVLLPYVVKNDLGASSLTLGFVFATGGLGAVGSAVWMGSRGQPRRHISFMYGTWTLATLAVAGYGLATAAWQLMLACLIFNALETAGTIVWATVKQRHVPSAMLGRVSSLDWLISIGLLPVSFALTAPVAATIGVRATLVGAAVVGATVTLGALFLPGMREIEQGDAPIPPGEQSLPLGRRAVPGPARPSSSEL